MSHDAKKPTTDQPESELHPTQDDSVLKTATHFEKYAATQAAANGIQGDVKQKNKSVEEKLGSQMTDMK